MSYCDYCSSKEENDFDRIYHDSAYGFPVKDDNELFGRLIMEINQAGLSWSLMLKKEKNFRLAFDNFNIDRISKYNDVKISELLNDSGIIRNRLKINSVIFNAQKIVSIQNEFGTFATWLDSHHPLTKDEWTKLFKKNFKFIGGEIVNEFLMSTGYLKGAHVENCTIFDKILEHKPKWKL
jgi:DNA-3-methyladenine glycosylase I